MVSQSEAVLQIGQNLRARRSALDLSPDEIARQTGLSRAAIYRYEAGHPIRADALGRLADALGVSISSLLGLGSEFTASALEFFARMHEIEATADHISVLFGPVSYLLTTKSYDDVLAAVLEESIPPAAFESEGFREELDQILHVLHARKDAYLRRRPGVMSLVSKAELEQFARVGFVGAQHVAEPELSRRRDIARAEIENVIRLIADPPIGVQIGVVEDSMPGTSFQLFRQGDAARVAVSPFRLGMFANVRIGVASISSEPQAVALHQQVTEDLWKNSLKGDNAIAALDRILSECAAP